MSNNILSKIRIDKQSGVSIYRQLQEQLEQIIKGGAWPQNEPLPSETILATHFNISVMTVRQAMMRLVNQGLIYREKGRGTFVAPQPLIHSLQRLDSFTEDMEARGLIPSTKIQVFEICEAPEIVAAKLGCEPGGPVLHIKRLRFIEERPVALHDAYLTRLDIDQAALDEIGSLYSLLESMEVHLLEAEEHLDAIAAHTELASLFNIPKGAPLLQISRTTWDDRHHPIEFVLAIYPANFYRYTVRLYR